MGKRANRKNRKNYDKQIKTSKSKQQEEQLPKITALPKIVGGNFDASKNLIEHYQQAVESISPPKEKIRVLFSTEASYLKTGFSTYLNEVFKRLSKNPNIELAELGSYGAARSQHPIANKIPWKYYHVMPTNDLEAQEYGMVNGQVINKNYQENQFGKWKFPHAVADFKPDIVLTHRDWWMDHWIKKNVFRNNFIWYWMPTVDGYPQKWEWLKDYSNVDGIYTYSWFGKNVIETQTRTPLAKLHKINPINVLDVCQAGVDLNIFKPMDKKEVKKIFGIPEEIKFVGTVMRNQPRKLFPRIIEAFKTFKKEHWNVSKNVFLLLHTSIPDVGWDINDIVYQNGVENFVLYTYICHKCGNLGISQFIGSPGKCPSCNEQAFFTPNTQFGFPPEHLNMIYNLLDVYIQGSIAEGDGMPVTEARAAGVPCLVSDYSALYEKARNGGAMPINSETLYTESETGQWRDLFSRKDLIKKLDILFRSENKRLQMSKDARACAEKFYSWDLCAKKWESIIMSTKLKDRNKTWNAPIEIKIPCPYGPPQNLSDEDFIKWCYVKILCRTGADDDGLHYWKRQLVAGASRQDLENHFRNLMEAENHKKKILANPNPNFTNPIERIKDTIKKAEGVNALEE